MSEHLFGGGPGHLSRRVARAAGRLGATLINHTDAGCDCGQGCASHCPARRRHWFAIFDRGEPFNRDLSASVLAAVDAAATKADKVWL